MKLCAYLSTNLKAHCYFRNKIHFTEQFCHAFHETPVINNLGKGNFSMGKSQSHSLKQHFFPSHSSTLLHYLIKAI